MKPSRPIRVLIADDEPLAREGLAAYLRAEDGVDIVATCSDGKDALRRIRQEDPDLLFLDVQMPEISGFEVLEALGTSEMPAVIFVTAHEEYALRAFRSAAVDYILKPIDPEVVHRAVVRAERYLRGSRNPDSADAAELRELLESMTAARTWVRKFAVKENDRIIFVDVKEIRWIEAERNYAVLHTIRGAHRVRYTMAELERRLNPEEFVRIHRSTIVRTERIKELEPLYQGDYLVVLEDGKKLVSSRSCRQNVKDLLDGIR